MNILQGMQSQMDSFAEQLALIKAPDSRQQQPPSTLSRSDGSRHSWADMMEEEDEEGDKENPPTGTKLFPVGSETEAFLRQVFSSKAENAVRHQWKDKFGAPHTAATACPKLDKILKSNLSHQTKSKDRQMSKQQALLLDAVGPMAYLLEEATNKTLTLENAVEAAQMALKLLGNASGHIATERRKSVLTNLNPRLVEMAEEEELFKEAPPNLFREGFTKKAKDRDD